MQKITFQNSRDQTLVGIVHPGPLQTPIILLHGFGSTKEKSDDFTLISNKINRMGFPVFRFDFAGSGESDYQIISHSSEIQDFKDIINFLELQGYKEFGVIGHSMGGLIGLKSCLDQNLKNKIKTFVLWSSPTQSMNHIWDLWYSKKQFNKLNTDGKLEIPLIDNKYMKSITISKDLIQDSINVDQEKLISNIIRPILFIHGDNDKIVPLEQSVTAMNFANEQSELFTLRNADHGCKNHLEEIADLCIDWFNQFLIK